MFEVELQDDPSADKLVIRAKNLASTSKGWVLELRDKAWPAAKQVTQDVPKKTNDMNDYTTLRLQPRRKGRELIWRAREYPTGEFCEWALCNVDSMRALASSKQSKLTMDLFAGAEAAASSSTSTAAG